MVGSYTLLWSARREIGAGIGKAGRGGCGLVQWEWQVVKVCCPRQNERMPNDGLGGVGLATLTVPHHAVEKGDVVGELLEAF